MSYLTKHPAPEETPQPDNEVERPRKKTPKAAKRKVKRRVAKGLLAFALILTGLLSLAEPWLLVAIVAALVALALLD